MKTKLLIGAVLLVLGMPTPASARLVAVDFFAWPTVYCIMQQEQETGRSGNGVECARRPRTGNTYVLRGLRETGRVRRTVLELFELQENVPRIPYGTTFAMSGGTLKIGPLPGAINCRSRRTSLTCRNRSGHGFTFTRTGYRQF